MCENGLQGNLLKQLSLCISTWGRSSAVLRSSQCFDPVSPGHSIVITTTHWIASSSPGLFLLVIGSAFSAALRCFPTMHSLGAQCGPYCLCWNTPDIPPLLGTVTFAIHALCTEFVGMCTWLSSFHMHYDILPPKVLSVPQWHGPL